MVSVKRIGRNVTNDIVINDPNISEFHATLKIGENNEVYIIDSVSDKGTFVNGLRIDTPHLLNSEDSISFGEYNFDWKSAIVVKAVEEEKAEPTSTSEQKKSPVEGMIKDKVKDISEIDIKQRWQKLKDGELSDEERDSKYKIWLIALSGLVILSFLIPTFSWYNTESGGWGGGEKFSGIEYILDLIERDFPVNKVVILRYFLVIVSFLGIFVSAALLFLKSIKVWRADDEGLEKKAIKYMLVFSMTVLVSQLLIYVSVFMDVNSPGWLEDGDMLTRLSMDGFGIGFWLTFIISIVLFKGQKNKNYDERLTRKWVPMSLMFWMPIVMLLAFTSKGNGWITQELDDQSPVRYEAYEAKKKKSVSAMQMMDNAMYSNIYRLASKDDTPDRNSTQKTIGTLLIFLNLGLLAYFVVLILMLFVESPFGDDGITSGFIAIVLLIILFVVLKLYTNTFEEMSSSMSLSVGTGFFLSFAANVALLVEAFSIRSKKKVT